MCQKYVEKGIYQHRLKFDEEYLFKYWKGGKEYKMVILDGSKKKKLEERQCEIEKEVWKCL